MVDKIEPKERQMSDVQKIVERVLLDTSGCQDADLALFASKPSSKARVLEILRSQEAPILSTDGACGPG